MQSMSYAGIINEKDTVAQIARCSFDVHVMDIMGTLICGGTLIMLHPEGILDFSYLTSLLKQKEITYCITVPSLLQRLFADPFETHDLTCTMRLRSLCICGEHYCSLVVLLKTFSLIGEPFNNNLIELLASHIPKQCKMWNIYGPAETIACAFHCIDAPTNADIIPVGKPAPNYRFMILNDFLQSVVTNQEGELFVGGVGVFAGYLRRDDLTARGCLEIDNDTFYRSGDIVKMDNHGMLYYVGRKDNQIKLHGQRVELGEIERCLLSMSISSCVVIKWGNDHLVAYIQSSDIDQEKLQEYCKSHLPAHMVPSLFIMLDKFPLNQNGKIDRKQLPAPNFSLNVSDKIYNENEKPSNELESWIHTLWCKLLGRTEISIKENFFNIGGHSLLLIQLYHNYQVNFNSDIVGINLAQIVENPTIADHARLINKSKSHSRKIQETLSSMDAIESMFHYFKMCQKIFRYSFLFLSYSTEHS